VVVACNGGELDTSADQEINQGRLHLGLTRLEIITTNESIVLLSELNCTRNKGVLRRSVDEGHTLKDTSHGKDSGWSDLLVTVFNSFQEVFSSIIDTRDEVSKSLSISSPLNNDCVQAVLGFEIADV